MDGEEEEEEEREEKNDFFKVSRRKTTVRQVKVKKEEEEGKGKREVKEPSCSDLQQAMGCLPDLTEQVKRKVMGTGEPHSSRYHHFCSEEVEWIQQHLSKWYIQHQRVMPWRTPAVKKEEVRGRGK